MTRTLRHEWHTALYDSELALSLTAKVVGGAVIEYANAEGVCWPSLRELSERVGVRSHRTVQKALRELERAGLLVVERHSGYESRYRMTLPPPHETAGVPPHDVAGVPPHAPPHAPPHETAGVIEPVEPEEPIRPSVVAPAPLNASSQALVAYYVDAARSCGGEPGERVKGHMAAELKRLSAAHTDEELRAGIDEMLAKGLVQPSILESVLLELAIAPQARRRNEHPVDAEFRRITGRDPEELR